MGAQLRVYRRRIKSVQQTKKITKAMELIASSRIIKAQNRVNAALPYTRELTLAISAAVSLSADTDHPLTSRQDQRKRAAVLLIAADRGLAGAYSSNIIREGEALNAYLREQGVEPVHFLVGRKVVNYYRFRGRTIEGEYTGFTDQPTVEDAKQIAIGLLASFLSRSHDQLGTDEIHIVYTHFLNMGRQEVRIRRILPIEVVEQVVGGPHDKELQPRSGEGAATTPLAMPLYEFEPDADSVLNALLPRYVENLVYTALLEACASEHAARRRAMKSATDNAEELIRSLTRQANQARQSEITQEISEIVGGADALATATAGS
ncbi:MAG: F0F1 ATP synthase subunit gamma [Candidatus Nanopelagicales bacterium]